MNDKPKRMIAVCGKGGTGKTAFIAIMTKLLTSLDSYKILVIDADPAMTLANVLGVQAPKTIGDIREEIIRRAAKARLSKDETRQKVVDELDYWLLEALAEKSRFGLLVMGRTEAEGCFCPVNDLLRDAVETLSRSFDITLIDGEAGIEQINRKVIRIVDTPLILTDLSSRGLQTASVIKDLVEKKKLIKTERLGLVINRVKTQDYACLAKLAEKVGLELVGLIPEDELIAEYDQAGRPLLELPDTSPSVQAVRKILEKVHIL